MKTTDAKKDTNEGELKSEFLDFSYSPKSLTGEYGRDLLVIFACFNWSRPQSTETDKEMGRLSVKPSAVSSSPISSLSQAPSGWTAWLDIQNTKCRAKNAMPLLIIKSPMQV